MNHGRLQSTAFIPVYYWRGARPALADLEPHQTGWLVCLSLTREGDVCLLPLAWDQDAPLNELSSAAVLPIPTFHTQALDNTAVRLTLNDLQQSGWQVNGRLTVHFTGADADPDFQKNIHHYLWHTPGGIMKDDA